MHRLRRRGRTRTTHRARRPRPRVHRPSRSPRSANASAAPSFDRNTSNGVAPRELDALFTTVRRARHAAAPTMMSLSRLPGRPSGMADVVFVGVAVDRRAVLPDRLHQRGERSALLVPPRQQFVDTERPVALHLRRGPRVGGDAVDPAGEHVVGNAGHVRRARHAPSSPDSTAPASPTRRPRIPAPRLRTTVARPGSAARCRRRSPGQRATSRLAAVTAGVALELQRAVGDRTFAGEHVTQVVDDGLGVVHAALAVDDHVGGDAHPRPAERAEVDVVHPVDARLRPEQRLDVGGRQPMRACGRAGSPWR